MVTFKQDKWRSVNAKSGCSMIGDWAETQLYRIWAISSSMIALTGFIESSTMLWDPFVFNMKVLSHSHLLWTGHITVSLDVASISRNCMHCVTINRFQSYYRAPGIRFGTTYVYINSSLMPHSPSSFDLALLPISRGDRPLKGIATFNHAAILPGLFVLQAMLTRLQWNENTSGPWRYSELPVKMKAG